MSARALAISMGDPAGVGPEIVVKTWNARAAISPPAFFAIGDPAVYARAAARLGAATPIEEIARPAEADGVFTRALPVLPVRLAAPETPGTPDPRNAPAVIEAIRLATEIALNGQAPGLVTCPIAKAALYEAGFSYPGHTEYVAALCEGAPHDGPRGPVMMLAGPSLKVTLASVHLPLARAVETLSKDAIMRVAAVTNESLKRDFGVARPRLALIGLNPHAGEGGALGGEERTIINPAAAALRAQGINATDALPPDTAFHAEARTGYDAAIAMYHDQGLIPLKTLHFWDAVNVTIGLPVVRTSPDHGVAFDIAGKGKARIESFVAALAMAHDIAARRQERARG